MQKILLEIVSNLCNVLDRVEDVENKNIVLGGDFIIFFDPILDVSGCSPIIQKKVCRQMNPDKRKI